MMPEHEIALNPFRENSDFLHYIVGVTCQKLQQINSTGHSDGPEGQRKEKLFVFTCSVAR